jgi:hypothetical protein
MPGAKPPTGIESDEIRRASRGAAAAPAVTLAVGISENGVIGSPHDEQNRLPAAVSAAQAGHCIGEGINENAD